MYICVCIYIYIYTYIGRDERDGRREGRLGLRDSAARAPSPQPARLQGADGRGGAEASGVRKGGFGKGGV